MKNGLFDDAFKAMDRAFSSMDEAFSNADLFGTGSRASSRAARRGPGYEINDGEAGRSILVEVPGCGPEDVDVTIGGGVLTVRWTAGRTGELQFRVGQRVTPESLVAKVDKGVLTVSLPRTERAEPARVRVT